MSILGDIGDWILSHADKVWDSIKASVNNVVQALGTAVQAVFSAVAGAWHGLTGAVTAALTMVENFASGVTSLMARLWNVTVPHILQGISDGVKSVASLATRAWGWVSSARDFLEKLIADGLAKTWQQVLDKIWTPLKGELSNAWNLATKAWNTISDWIKNPGHLAAFLFAPLFSMLINASDAVIEYMATTLIRLFLKSIGRIAGLLEKIIADIF